MDETRTFQFGCQMVSKKAVQLFPFLRVLWGPRLEGAGTCFFLSHISIHDSIHVTWMHMIFHWPKVSSCLPDYIHINSYMFFSTMGFWMCIYIHLFLHIYFFLISPPYNSQDFYSPKKNPHTWLEPLFFPQKNRIHNISLCFFPWGDHKPVTRRQNNDLKS